MIGDLEPVYLVHRHAPLPRLSPQAPPLPGPHDAVEEGRPQPPLLLRVGFDGHPATSDLQSPPRDRVTFGSVLDGLLGAEPGMGSDIHLGCELGGSSPSGR